MLKKCAKFIRIFGFFLMTFVSSDIHNIEEILWFIESFAPFDGLSGPMEFSLATAKALKVQLAKVCGLSSK